MNWYLVTINYTDAQGWARMTRERIRAESHDAAARHGKLLVWKEQPGATQVRAEAEYSQVI